MLSSACMSSRKTIFTLLAVFDRAENENVGHHFLPEIMASGALLGFQPWMAGPSLGLQLAISGCQGKCFSVAG